VRRAARARSTTPGRTASTAATSARVEEWPRVSRSAPAASSSTPWPRARGCAGDAGAQARAGGRGHAGGVEQVEQILPAQPSDSDGGRCRAVARRARPARAATATRHTRENPRDQVVAQRPDPPSACSAAGDRLVERGCEPGQRRDRHACRGAARPPPTAVQQRVQHGAAAHEQRARPAGAPTLCPDTLTAAARTACRSTGSWPNACTASTCTGTPVPLGERDGRRHRLDRTDLVVRPHQRDQRDLSARQLGRQRIEVEDPVAVHRQQLEPSTLVPANHAPRLQHRVVLDGTDQHPVRARPTRSARPVQADDGEVVALPSAPR